MKRLTGKQVFKLLRDKDSWHIEEDPWLGEDMLVNNEAKIWFWSAYNAVTLRKVVGREVAFQTSFFWFLIIWPTASLLRRYLEKKSK